MKRGKREARNAQGAGLRALTTVDSRQSAVHSPERRRAQGTGMFQSCRFQGFRIPEFQGFKVPGSRVSGSKNQPISELKPGSMPCKGNSNNRGCSPRFEAPGMDQESRKFPYS